MINILLCTNNISLTKEFYEALDVKLTVEKHGDGPTHYSFSVQTQMEIYPPRKDIPDANFVIRIMVDGMDLIMQKLATLEYDYKIGGKRFLKSGVKQILQDPDGRIVEIFEPKL